MVKKPCAVLLCKFSDDPQEPRPIQFYSDFFTEQGAGKGGAFDYWSTVSYGNLDLRGTQVFGWFTMRHSTEELARLAFPGDRSVLAAWGVEAAAANGLWWLLGHFAAIIVVLNRSTDHGSAGGNRVVLGYAPAVWEPTFVLHEMGHAFGLNHSWSGNPDAEYGDPWDIMSAMRVYTFRGRFNEVGPGSSPPLSGPGMNAPYLDRLGCMPADRVWSPGSGMGVASITLTALNHPETDGYLMAKVPHASTSAPSTPTYTLEFRQRDGWDRGIPRSTVLVHQVRTDGLSYLQRSGLGYELQPGQTFRGSGPEIEAQVMSIDSLASRAILKIKWVLHRWYHLSPIAGHGMEADIDCSGLDYAGRFGVTGDFDGDGRQELTVAPAAAGSAGNDLWVMKYDPAAKGWHHLSPIAGHGMEADIDCSGLDYAARFAVTGDFDGDGNHEIAVAPAAGGSAGNDLWVMKYDAGAGGWHHLSPIPGHGMEADIDCSGLDYAAQFGVTGDFDGDGQDEVVVAPAAGGSSGNDLWVMKYDPGAGGWHHLSPIPGHGMEADIDCSGLDYAAKLAVSGDFDGDGRDEIAVAPATGGSAGNDLWVMKYDPGAGSWHHVSAIGGHGMEADIDCSGLDYPAFFINTGDFDGDGQDEVVVAPVARGSSGNDLWVMKYRSGDLAALLPG